MTVRKAGHLTSIPAAGLTESGLRLGRESAVLGGTSLEKKEKKKAMGLNRSRFSIPYLESGGELCENGNSTLEIFKVNPMLCLRICIDYRNIVLIELIIIQLIL